MGKLGVGIGLFCIVVLVCVHARGTTDEQEMMTVTGKLVRIVAVGGETTGWSIQLDSEIKIKDKPVTSIEVNHETKRYDKLKNKHVEAKGKLTFWHGVERGDRPVLEVTTIREIKSK